MAINCVLTASTNIDVATAVEREAKRLGISKSKVIERALRKFYCGDDGESDTSDSSVERG